MAEEHFRRIGYQKTSVADIASCLGMSSANIYRFFPSRAAINKSICGRFIEKATRLADAVARQEAPAHEKLESLFKLLHEERRKNFVEEKPVHDLIVAATAESWPVISAIALVLWRSSKILSKKGQTPAILVSSMQP
ncbi:TetR/AcrR family transcriptional regulator [Rhizobium ruizarguesonis]|uniref:TetR/AcrR family transcriptional regulator n=1 Tax=Rhizobium ruizarguesonis TaxID=2081791 RepID=UPI0028BEF6AA|nr:TetR/AcrR family transcriptional regulator [Rhizobium ruizarguesonis]